MLQSIYSATKLMILWIDPSFDNTTYVKDPSIFTYTNKPLNCRRCAVSDLQPLPDEDFVLIPRITYLNSNTSRMNHNVGTATHSFREFCGFCFHYVFRLGSLGSGLSAQKSEKDILGNVRILLCF